MSFKRKRLIPFRSSMKKRAKKAKAGISNPANEDLYIKDTPEQSVAALRHERQWGAARDFINGKISEEEFQQCVQQLIAAKCDKGSHIGASNVVQQAAKTQQPQIYPSTRRKIATCLAGGARKFVLTKARPRTTWTA